MDIYFNDVHIPHGGYESGADHLDTLKFLEKQIVSIGIEN